MNIKMIVTDLDNTLLRNDKTISKYTKEIFEELINRGYKVAFATARPRRSAQTYTDIIKFHGIICHNGSQVFTTGENPYEAPPLLLPKEYTKNILMDLNKRYPGIHLSTEMGDMMYANFDPNIYWPGVNHTRTDFSDFNDTGTHKILIKITSDEQYKYILSLINKTAYGQFHDGDMLLIMHSQCNKVRGIKLLSSYFNIKPEEILAFGDDNNDIDMLKYCGVGVAVKNALNNVKSISDYITDNNENDGVAKFIEKNLF